MRVRVTDKYEGNGIELEAKQQHFLVVYDYWKEVDFNGSNSKSGGFGEQKIFDFLDELIAISKKDFPKGQIIYNIPILIVEVLDTEANRLVASNCTSR